MPRTVAPVKLIAIICLVMVLGLLRAERGVSELRGRAGEPSRLLHITNDRNGVWQFSILGFQHTLNTAIVVVQTEEPLLELPVSFRWSEFDWQALAQGAIDWIYSCLEAACGPFWLPEPPDDPKPIFKGRPV